MYYKILQFIQLLLPFGLLIFIYRNSKAIPANIQTRSGRTLKAIMVTENDGILISQDKYIKNRAELLQKRKMLLEQANEQLAKEINELSFQMREELLNSNEEESY